jgi:hypothetical protein
VLPITRADINTQIAEASGQKEMIDFEIYEQRAHWPAGLGLRLVGEAESASPPSRPCVPRSAIEFMMELTDHNESSISRPPLSGVV